MASGPQPASAEFPQGGFKFFLFAQERQNTTLIADHPDGGEVIYLIQLTLAKDSLNIHATVKIQYGARAVNEANVPFVRDYLARLLATSLSQL